MRSYLCKGIATIAAIGCIGVVAAATLQDFRLSLANDGASVSAYETTGSVGAMSSNRANLPLTDEQLDRVYQAVMHFPDAAHAGVQAPELADKLPSEEPLQDLPASVTGEIPHLQAHKFVKLGDRILLIDPASRVVVAMIPRYRLLP